MTYREYMEWLAYFNSQGKKEPGKKPGMSWQALKYSMLAHISTLKGKRGRR